MFLKRSIHHLSDEEMFICACPLERASQGLEFHWRTPSFQRVEDLQCKWWKHAPKGMSAVWKVNKLTFANNILQQGPKHGREMFLPKQNQSNRAASLQPGTSYPASMCTIILKYSNLNENIKEIFRIFILLVNVLTASLLECQKTILLHMMDSSL